MRRPAVVTATARIELAKKLKNLPVKGKTAAAVAVTGTPVKRVIHWTRKTTLKRKIYGAQKHIFMQKVNGRRRTLLPRTHINNCINYVVTNQQLKSDRTHKFAQFQGAARLAIQEISERNLTNWLATLNILVKGNRRQMPQDRDVNLLKRLRPCFTPLGNDRAFESTRSNGVVV